jgi:hypothetical protein
MSAVLTWRFFRRESLEILLSIGVAVLHFFVYTYSVGLYFFEKIGGVQKHPGGWTHYGGVDYAWTIPIQLPGTIALEFNRQCHKTNSSCDFDFASKILIVAGSLLTSYVIASFAMNLMNREKIDFGRYGWKMIVFVAGIIWIPVPVRWSLIYHVTVLY